MLQHQRLEHHHGLRREERRDCRTYDPQVPREWGRYACCEPVARGLAFWKARSSSPRWMAGWSALDAKTGKPVWTATTFDKSQPWSITGAPRVFDGKVVVGNGGADLGVRGFVSARDADTGKFLLEVLRPVPGDPSKGPDGAASDSVMAMAREDLDRRMVEAGRRRHRVGFHRLRPRAAS